MTLIFWAAYAIGAGIAGLVLYTLAKVLVHPNSDGDD